MENLADGVPGLLHIALFLFLAGLAVFLFPINKDVAWSATAASAAFTVIYLTLAALHLAIPSWPYHTPLSYAIAITVIVIFGPIPSVTYTAFSLVGAVALLAMLPLLLLAGLIVFILHRGFGVPLPFDWRSLWESFNGSSAKLRRLPRDVLLPHETLNRIRPYLTEVKRDRMVLQWLLSQSNTVEELEELIEGIEPFVDHLGNNHELPAKFVLELGGKTVGSFYTGFGQFVGMLLHSSSVHADVPLEARQSRATSCTRALIAVLAYTKSEARIADTFLSITGWLTWIPTQKLLLPTYVPIRWRWWAPKVTLHGIRNLRNDPDPVLSFLSHCLAAVVIHRSLVDIAFRIQQGEVIIQTPVDWDVQAILKASRAIQGAELFELLVAVSLTQPPLEDENDEDDEDNEDRSSIVEPIYGVPPGQWSWKSRPISVTFALPTTDGTSDSEADEKIASFRASRLRNEATLFTVHTLLEHVSKSSLSASLSHYDLLRRTVSALLQDGSGAEASAEMQLDFLGLLSDIYSDDDAEADGAESQRDVEVASIADSAPPSPKIRSLLRRTEIMDLLLPFVKTLDSAQCLSLMEDVQSRLRFPRPPTTEPSKTADVDDKVSLQKEEEAVLDETYAPDEIPHSASQSPDDLDP